MFSPTVLKKIFLNSYVLLLLIIITACAVRFICFTGVTYSDDWGYSYDAYNILRGTYSIKVPTNFDNYIGYLESTSSPLLRFGLMLPVTFLYALFGVNEVSSILYPLLTSLGNIILIYFIGKLIANEKTGLIAALFLAFYPIDVILSTQLWPDIPVIFYGTLAVFLLLKGDRSEKTRSYSLYYYFCGFLVGISYLVKITGLYTIPFLAIYSLVYRKRRTVRSCYLIAGFVTVLAIEAFVYYGITGDLLFRYHMTTKSVARDFRAYGQGIYSTLQETVNIFFYTLVNPTNFLHGMYCYLACIAIPYCCLKKVKSSYTLLLWLMTSSLFSIYTGYATATMARRYTIYIIIPLTLILACFCTKIKLSGVYQALIIVFLIGTAIFTLIAHNARYGRNLTYNAKVALSYFMQQNDKNPIFTDRRTRHMLQHFLGYKDTLVISNNLQDIPTQCGDECYMLVNWDIIDMGLGAVLPEFENPPSHWKQVKIIKNPSRGFGIWVGIKNLWAKLGGAASDKETLSLADSQNNQIDRTKDAVIYHIINREKDE